MIIKEDDRGDFMQMISKNNYIDTTAPESILKYQKNLNELVKEAKEKCFIDKFVIIREDDFFPYDWKWRVTSKDTYYEYNRGNISRALKLAKVDDELLKEGINPFIPQNKHHVLERLNKLDPMYGAILEPAKYRSTKHFTINTALEYTGSYNNVKTSRLFTVIDKIDNFINSGYAYSMDYQDAYLDITHEELPISNDAIILIDKNRFDEIKDKRILEDLKNRNVILYNGDIRAAVNMVLSENGVLPKVPGLSDVYDIVMFDMFEESMIDFCEKHKIDYSLSHGNLYGRGGHFTDKLDSENNEDIDFQHRFIDFLKNEFKEYADEINIMFFSSPPILINRIGYEKVAQAIEKYNKEIASVDYIKKYDEERDKITISDHEIFTGAIRLLKAHADLLEKDNELKDAALNFYHSNNVEGQRTSALKCIEIIGKYINANNGMSL